MSWQFTIFVIFENSQRVTVIRVCTSTDFKHRLLKNRNRKIALLPTTLPTSICLLCTLSTSIVKSWVKTMPHTLPSGD